MSNYDLKFYRTFSKREVVVDFIRSFSDTELSKVHNDLDLLEKYGLQLLNTPLVKKIYIRPPIYELRIKSKVEIRLFFYFQKPNIFIILHGFVKKSNKTPHSELKTAIMRVKTNIDNH